MAEAVIVSAVRTPIGRASKGVLKDVRADDLAAVAVRGALARVPQLDASLIEDLIFGCAFPEGEQGMNIARIIVALAGLPETVAARTRMPSRCVAINVQLPPSTVVHSPKKLCPFPCLTAKR